MSENNTQNISLYINKEKYENINVETGKTTDFLREKG